MKYFITTRESTIGKIYKSAELLVYVDTNENTYYPMVGDFFNVLQKMGIKDNDQIIFDQHSNVKKCLAMNCSSISCIKFNEDNVRKTQHGIFGLLTIKIITDDLFNCLLKV